MTYKCKVCAGSVIIDQKSGIATCEYCGTKQVLPRFADDKSHILYAQGAKYLNENEYDKAENIFSQLLAINPQDPELYWDLVLCKYGVSYVCDPKTDRYVPTCNRTHYSSVFNDENYKKALELSTGEKHSLYKSDAETIDNIQKGIISVSKKEKPFDIFISYKEADAEGNRTKDSVKAQELYEKLTNAGYKVFFSRITLEDKIGSQYEPYIYSALYSSKVMLTVSSSKEYINAPWVRNEWSRYLNMTQKDSSKTLIPLYYDMDKEDLPEEFALLTSIDMSEEGFEQELLRGIKKLIPLPIMRAQRRKQIRKTLGIVAAVILIAVSIAAAIIIPAKIKETEQLQIEKANGDKYSTALKAFDDKDYTTAKTLFEELGEYRDSVAMIEKCGIQPDYDKALQDYYDGDYAQATWGFDALGEYEDAPEMKAKAELSWRKSLATVVCRDPNLFNHTLYYITENGTVDILSGSGNAHIGIDITKHGNVVSIAPGAPGGKLYALHEDGYVSNAKENNHLDDDSEWHNIVQISSYIEGTNFVLRNDGKILYSICTYVDEYNKQKSNDWFFDEHLSNAIEKFENRYSSFFCVPDYAVYNVVSGLHFCGVKSDKTLSLFAGGDYSTTKWSGSGEVVEKSLSFNELKIEELFSDVKRVLYYNYNNIAIQTYSEVIMGFNNNNYFENDNYKDNYFVGFNYYSGSVELTINSNYELIDLSANKVLLYDAVKVIDSYPISAITKTGTIYLDNSTDNKSNYISTNKKTIVYDEWLKEMD